MLIRRIRVQFGQDLLNSALSTDCYDLSENFVTVVPYRFLVTDEQNIIRSILPADSLNFDTLPAGVFRVWGLSYTGTLLAQVGQDAAIAVLANNCFELSSNFVRVSVGAGLDAPGIPDLQVNTPSTKANTAQSLQLGLYPNPAQEELYLSFENMALGNARASIRILHPTGAVLRRWTLDTSPGKNTTLLNVQELPAGWYLLEMQLNGERQVVKWVKQD
ncbi:MAG: T9SS type A sorting domain-containing protein [Haliscomenobacter sp.]|nr:T9SS type A sorting domain-containing protein [Haliscomenobacter sp.]MBK9489879.1 T9SS type A sorting domain-containing protein [Haliscomenobacter sp.]